MAEPSATAGKRPAQHNDSITTAEKRADQGPTLRGKGPGPHNAEVGRGHDERGQYGRSDGQAGTDSNTAQKTGQKRTTP